MRRFAILVMMLTPLAFANTARGEEAPFYYVTYNAQPKFEAKTLRTANTNYWPIGATLNWGLVGFRYQSERDRNAYYSFADNKPYFERLGKGVKAWIQIKGISPSGRDLVLHVTYENKEFQTNSGEHKFHFDVPAYVAQCDEKPLVPIFKENVSLWERLERGLAINEMHHCELKFRVTPRVNVDYATKFQSPTETLQVMHNSIIWNIQENTLTVNSLTPNIVRRSSDGLAPNQVSGPDRTTVVYKRITEMGDKKIYDKEKARAAIDAGKELVADLVNYGDKVLLLSIEDSPTRSTFHQSYLTMERVQNFERWIQEINQGAPHMPPSHLIGLHSRINNAYEFIRHFEQDVLRWNHTFFDELSDRSLPDQ